MNKELDFAEGNETAFDTKTPLRPQVRGALLACGRPDGRLAALTSAENAVCLSVNQASSIQSLGGTCESLTVSRRDQLFSWKSINLSSEKRTEAQKPK